ncbi:uncharacterized protein SCODWIG_00428 [Saccharomycodes ludwigii]|uniref:Phosphatidate phosphatase APP1 catalytic domain-containing protein n=1 Tax=Saccharomycodes ludwigii TaxID=36035 RepID=A0A376B1X4_9ASCO|nr:uncharacterized protein SCODWIG_00428 [Saccharomycodes ludwigii]
MTYDYNGNSKRKRIYNIMKNTKDAYLPTITSSFNQLRSEASSSMKYYYNNSVSNVYDQSNQQEYQHQNAENTKEFLNNAKIVIYPIYSTFNSVENLYLTHVKGNIYLPGVMNRKNRLIYSLCKQLMRKPTNSDTLTTLIENQEISRNDSMHHNDIDDTASVASSAFPSSLASSPSSSSSSPSSSSSSSSSSPDLSSVISSKNTNTSENSNKIFDSRISGFLSKGVNNCQISLYVDNQLYANLKSDELGNFECLLTTIKMPNNVTCKCLLNSNISNSINVVHYSESAISVISDIDDTIKHTGVVGDKRSLICNTFQNDYSQWLIPSVSKWYGLLSHNYSIEFFYVSNSPIQLYPFLQEFISQFYPSGVIFLKEYFQGNLLSNIMVSSAKRKLGFIAKVIRDYPSKKFILIGDSGEKDLEAYITTAIMFPKQVLAIYIRSVPGSLSDLDNNDEIIRQNLNDMIEKHYLNITQEHDSSATCHNVNEHITLSSPPLSNHKNNSPEVIPDLITFDDDCHDDNTTVDTIKSTSSSYSSSSSSSPPRKPFKKKNLLTPEIEEEIKRSQTPSTAGSISTITSVPGAASTITGDNSSDSCSRALMEKKKPPVPRKSNAVNAAYSRAILDGSTKATPITPVLKTTASRPPPPPVPPRKTVNSCKSTSTNIAKDVQNNHIAASNSSYANDQDGGNKNTREFEDEDEDDYCYYTPSSQNDYGSYETFMDKRADMWRRRVEHAITQLSTVAFRNGTQNKIRLKFFKDDCLQDSIDVIEEASGDKCGNDDQVNVNKDNMEPPSLI